MKENTERREKTKIIKLCLNIYCQRGFSDSRFLEGLITDAELWFGYVDKRNITVHEYYEKITEEVYPILPQFLKNLDLLIKNLEKTLMLCLN